MMAAFFHFQHTLNRFFNSCIKFYWIWISSSWNMKGGQIEPPLPPPGKTPSKSPALLGLIQSSIQQDYLSELYPSIPINIYGKPWGWGRIPPNSQKIYSFPPPEKPHLINLLLPLSKMSFLPHQIVIFI